MTLVLEIRPEVEDALAQQAAAHGLELGTYATSLLEDAAQIGVTAPPPSARNMVDLFAPLRGLNLDFERDRDTGRDIHL